MEFCRIRHIIRHIVQADLECNFGIQLGQNPNRICHLKSDLPWGRRDPGGPGAPGPRRHTVYYTSLPHRLLYKLTTPVRFRPVLVQKFLFLSPGSAGSVPKRFGFRFPVRFPRFLIYLVVFFNVSCRFQLCVASATSILQTKVC